MPSLTKRMINPRPVRGGDDVGVGGAAARQHQQGYDPTLVGKRTGVTVPPRGQVTFDSPSSGDVLFENPDAFFAAARSGGKKNKSSSSLAGGSDDDAGDNNRRRMSPRGKKGGRQGVEEDKNERRRREREEFEEEARRNAARRPDILQSDEEEDDNEQEDGKPRFKDRASSSYQRTPIPPGNHTRMLHRAMGVPTAGGPDYNDNSPTFTVLSKVSTAAPSTRGSSDAGSKKSSSIVAKSRHAMREEQDRVQLERLANRGNASPPLNEDDEDYGNDEDDFGPVDPPEEQSRIQAKGSGGAAGRGVDPDEREDVLEPEPDALEKSLVEVSNLHGNNDYDDDDDFGGGGMHLAPSPRQDYDAEEEDVHFGTQVGDGDDDAIGGDFHGGDDDDEEDEERRAPSSKKHTSKKEDTKKAKKKQSKKKDERESSVDTTPTSVLRTSKKSKKKKQTTSNRVNWSTPTGISRGIPAGNRDYEAVPVSVYREDRDEDSASLRRSNRARFAPLAFWKNEKLIYEAQHEEGILGEAMGDMPVVVAVQKAQPTPYKEVKRTVPEKKKTKSKNKEGKRKRGGDSDSEDDDDTNVSSTKKKFDDATLRKKYRIHNGESGKVWSETLESVTDTKIVSRIDNRTFSKLPLSASRKKRESKVVGFASQSFHVPTDDDDLFPGYISGNVVLPPRGIKDAEGVGLCSQVFNVGDCQPNSLEFALADPSGQDGEFDPKTAQRFLLSKGDMFQIPPGNVYRIENHSANVKATLFWTIIKCTSRAEQDEEDSEEDR